MKNGFKKGFFKLMNSAVYEKTMKDLDKIVDMRLVSNKRKVCRHGKYSTRIYWQCIR